MKDNCCGNCNQDKDLVNLRDKYINILKDIVDPASKFVCSIEFGKDQCKELLELIDIPRHETVEELRAVYEWIHNYGICNHSNNPLYEKATKWLKDNKE